MYRTRRILLTLLLCLLLSGGITKAETVSRKEASKIAELFFNASRGQKMASPNFAFTGRDFTTNRLFIPFYVFNHPTGGFVIISAENKAYPILAYSTTGKLEAGNLTQGQRALLRLYGTHIEQIRYESDPATEAIMAWGDIKSHIAAILNKDLNSTDLLSDWESVEDEVSELTGRADLHNLESANYSANQWIEAVSDELRNAGNVVLALPSTDGQPVALVATGHQGDYFRLRFGRQPGDAMYRLLPTEQLSRGEIAILSKPKEVVETTVTEEPAFSFYDDFMEEIRRETESQKAAITDILDPEEPVMEWLGDGHFSVWMPENVRTATIYNIAGVRLSRQGFRDTDIAILDVSKHPSGFYIALITGESGRQYAFRLFR